MEGAGRIFIDHELRGQIARPDVFMKPEIYQPIGLKYIIHS
jgi:hypothetical protein